MNDISENNLVRFMKITKKKNGIFANFRIKGMKGGSVYSTSIEVDIAAAEVDAGDPLEKIIDACARIAVREYKKTEPRFEGLAAI